MEEELVLVGIGDILVLQQQRQRLTKGWEGGVVCWRARGEKKGSGWKKCVCVCVCVCVEGIGSRGSVL